MCEHVLETLVICEHIHVHSVQLMPPIHQCKHYNVQLYGMSGIIILMNLMLSGRIGYKLTTVHENITQTKPRCITINSLILTTFR